MKTATFGRHLKPVLGAALVVAVLASCSQDTVIPTPPADAPTALVYGMAGGPLYEALKGYVKMTVGNGSQKATDFDLVIFDGDGFGAQQLHEDALIREAVHGNVWVLGLDLEEAHKDVGLGDLLLGSSKGSTDAYLVRQAKDAQGRLGSRLIEFVNPDQEADYQAQRIVGYVEEEVAPQQTVPGDIPTRALTYFIHYASDYSGPLPNTMNPVFNGTTGRDLGLGQANNPQQATWTVDHRISLFLDAGNDPKGDFQHVLVDLVGLASPNTLAIDNIDDASDNNGMSEIAWFQTRFDASTTVPKESGLVLTKASPENANGSRTVTSGGYSFGVGYSEDSGASASFQYTSPQTVTTITDWQLINTSGDAAQWNYASNTVYDGMNTDGFDPGAWFYYFEGVVPQHPNSLATETLNYATESYWLNNEVYDGKIAITGTDTAWYTDAWAVLKRYDDNPGGNSPWCVDYDDQCARDAGEVDLIQHMARHKHDMPWALTVDMSAVIPVPTKSLTFSKNPATAGDTVQATLTLESPTPIPAEVLMTSKTSGVTPEHDSYIIPANEDTLTFNVLTGAEGCQPKSATIEAFYADGQNAVLTVNPPPNCQ